MPNTLTNAPLQYAPQNELGVVYLFAHIAKIKQCRIEEIRSQFPDRIAYRRSGDQEKLVQIEFEFKSSSFKVHGHDLKKCDCIVCWYHEALCYRAYLKGKRRQEELAYDKADIAEPSGSDSCDA